MPIFVMLKLLKGAGPVGGGGAPAAADEFIIRARRRRER